MPDIKEKLVELLDDSSVIFQPETVEYLADRLIANGVTFAEDIKVPTKWISVEERLPKSEGSYLVYRKDAMGQMYVDITGYYYGDLWTHIWRNEVTHWMSMPEPPKGE